MTISFAAFVVISLSIITQIVFLFLRKNKADFISHFLLLAGALLLLADLVVRSIQINFVAITNMYESLVLFSALVALVLFFYRVRAGEKTHPMIMFGGSMVAFILLALASSPLLPKEALPPIPALQSAWLVLHITLAFAGEAFFVVGFVAAIIYLFARDPDKRQNIERVMYTAIAIGYPIFTAGALIFGAVWAHFAWGAF